jgi:hypothetical protein
MKDDNRIDDAGVDDRGLNDGRADGGRADGVAAGILRGRANENMTASCAEQRPV